MIPTPTTEEARALAIQFLSGLPRRLTHLLAVGAHCEQAAQRARLDPPWYDPVVAAAYLHDLAYAPALQQTGFHPLDGARYLRARGWDYVARLVAHHSQARLEARALGLSLAEFRRP